MKIKLVHPTKINPDGIRVFHLAPNNYYLIVSKHNNEGKAYTGLPIVVIDFSTWGIVKMLDFRCQWKTFSAFEEENENYPLANPSQFIFQVEKRVAKEYIWFFLKEFAFNEFSVKIPSTIPSIRYRHKVIDIVTQQIRQYHENSTIQS